MSDQGSSEPSDGELIAFAGKLLGHLGDDLAEGDVLRDTVREARELWLLLYRANRGDQPQP